MSNFRIGIPSKGRLCEQATELLVAAGLSFRRQDRSLFAQVEELPVDVAFLRTSDIPVLCAEGAIDLGISGSDVILESGAHVQTRLALGISKCRLAVLVGEEDDIQKPEDLDGRRIATKFLRVTSQYLASHDAQAHLVKFNGSIEIMTSLGVADAMVDIVETGSTLAANRLRILDEIGHFESVLLQTEQNTDKDMVDLLVRRLEGVVIARSYSLLEYNIPREKLAEAEKITPGFNSPTVNALEAPQWCAVRAMVRRKQAIEAMEKLETLGASAILETRIANCRL
ncbi:MAG: ATP phosphoribosyltransferase [Gemmatimonadetes bacterium]|nr:ATP phosphoribosyltransferase [Gemmatimonadota bacterium]MBT7456221.1 ATP phosphoribosyltransferase [Gemmatimonadota bacterium]